MSRTGQVSTRAIKALAVSRGSVEGAVAYARGQWRDADPVVSTIRATVDATTSGEATLSPGGVDLVEFTRPQSIIGKLPLLRRVPPRVRTILGTAGTTAYWTGERDWRPVSKMSFDDLSTLNPLSVSAIAVFTEELARSSDPDAEVILSRDINRAVVQALDSAFIDPDNAGSSGAKPASITNGVTPFHSAGSTVANIDADLQLLVKALAAAGSDLSAAVFVMLPRTAIALAGLRVTNGDLAYPGMTAKGGTLLGLPAITSSSVPIDTGSPTTVNATITLLDQSEIAVTDDGGTGIQVSSYAALAMDPDALVGSPSAGAQAMLSLFQSHCMAAKLTRSVNWQVARDGMVQVLDLVGY